MRIKGVVFDFNGTLFWDTDLHNRAWDIFLEKRGKKMNDDEKSQKMHGRNNREILNIFFPEGLSEQEIKVLSLEKERIYQELCLTADMKLAPGAESLLDFLKKQRIPNTIATSSGIENVDFYFEKMNLGLYFNRSDVVYNDGSMVSKPDPQIFHKAFRMLGVQAGDILVFEDSLAGIMAAEKADAGMIIIVDPDGNHSDRSKHQVIKSFNEVNLNLF